MVVQFLRELEAPSIASSWYHAVSGAIFSLRRALTSAANLALALKKEAVRRPPAGKAKICADGRFVFASIVGIPFSSFVVDSTTAQDIGCKCFRQDAYKNISICTVIVQSTVMPTRMAPRRRVGRDIPSPWGLIASRHVAHDLLNAYWLRPFPAESARKGSVALSLT